VNEITYKPIEEKYALEVAKLLKLCFPLMPPDEQYDAKELIELAQIFPEGTIIALDGDTVIGMGTGIFTDLDLDNLPPTEDDILYAPDGRNLHNWNGCYYFGSDMAVHPDYRGRRIGREIYNRRKAVVQKYNKKGFVAAAVLPGYAEHEATLDIHAYLTKVVAGELYDPTLTMQLRNDFQVIRSIPDFFIYPRSSNWSALILWPNPDFKGD
jgi:GNAT superfamily N-acetyltransferase